MLEILYADSAIVAINKPTGMLVHRSGLAPDRVTCVSLLRKQIDEWVYPMHRLDRGTSGVLLFARTAEAASALSRAFADRQVQKSYLTIVRGWAPEHVDVDYALDDEEKPGSPRVEARSVFSRAAVVELPFSVGRYPSARYSLVVAEPHTGRRHQLRRHLAHLRHPVIGDARHGDGHHNRFFRESFGITRILLHAQRLTFEHPHEAHIVAIDAPLPIDLVEIVSRLGWDDDVASIRRTLAIQNNAGQ